MVLKQSVYEYETFGTKFQKFYLYEQCLRRGVALLRCSVAGEGGGGGGGGGGGRGAGLFGLSTSPSRGNPSLQRRTTPLQGCPSLQRRGPCLPRFSGFPFLRFFFQNPQKFKTNHGNHSQQHPNTFLNQP